MNLRPFIHVVADYGHSGDLAYAEVTQRLKKHVPEAEINVVCAPPFATLTTGFLISQLAINSPISNMAIFSNTAPRKDDSKKRKQNAGEEFMFAKLKNGIIIGGVHAGYCFSLVKDHIAEFKKVNVANKGSQFRSRDFYPEAFARILREDAEVIGEAVDIDTIPDFPSNKILYIDGYGNIKTSIRHSEVQLNSAEKIRIGINGNFRTAVYADGSFSVKAGDLAFAPGSSGGEDKFMEVFLRGGSANDLFFSPKVESDITIDRFED